MVRTRSGLGLAETFRIMSLNSEVCCEKRRCGGRAFRPIIKGPRDTGQFWLCQVTFHAKLFAWILPYLLSFLPCEFRNRSSYLHYLCFCQGCGASCQNWECHIARGDIFPLWWEWIWTSSPLKCSPYLQKRETVNVISWKFPLMPPLCISL